MTQPCSRTARLTRPTVASLALLALVGGAARSAASASPRAGVRAVDIASARLSGSYEVTLTGRISCTPRARFGIYGWVLDRKSGAFGKGRMPPKVPAGSAAAARWKRATACTGSPQAWTLLASSAGRTRLPFATGPGVACVTVYLRKDHRFTDLEQRCTAITLRP